MSAPSALTGSRRPGAASLRKLACTPSTRRCWHDRRHRAHRTGRPGRLRSGGTHTSRSEGCHTLVPSVRACPRARPSHWSERPCRPPSWPWRRCRIRTRSPHLRRSSSTRSTTPWPGPRAPPSSCSPRVSTPPGRRGVGACAPRRSCWPRSAAHRSDRPRASWRRRRRSHSCPRLSGRCSAVRCHRSRGRSSSGPPRPTLRPSGASSSRQRRPTSGSCWRRHSG